jgi:hypothetical protein
MLRSRICRALPATRDELSAATDTLSSSSAIR